MTFIELLNARFEKLDHLFEEGMITDDGYFELWHKLMDIANEHIGKMGKLPIAHPIPDHIQQMMDEGKSS